MTQNPKVFLCHGSEDKARFVETFATALRKNGVDAFLDKWEIGLGDTLWERISTGIDECDAFILVASKTSVSKPWVKLEIGGGLSRKIQDKAKFIVIVLDDCGNELPALLRSSRYLPVKDPANFNAELTELLATLFGQNSRPPLGSTPAYHSSVPIPAGAELTATDWRVLCRLCEISMSDSAGSVRQGWEDVHAQLGLSANQYLTSLQILDEQGYIELSRASGKSPVGDNIVHLRIKPFGFEEFATVALPGYEDTKTLAIATIVNHGHADRNSLQQAIDVPPRVLRHIAQWIELMGLAQVSFWSDGEPGLSIHGVTARMKRMVEP